MSAECPFIEQATRPRLTNVLVMAGLVNRRCHRPSIEQGVGPRTAGMTVFLSCWIRRGSAREEGS
jgi:hypothetical protein